MQNSHEKTAGMSASEVARFFGISFLAVVTICATFPAQARADGAAAPVYAQSYPPPPAYPPSSPPPSNNGYQQPPPNNGYQQPPPPQYPPQGGYGYQQPPAPMDVASAVIDGKNDADSQINGTLWFGAGCLLPLVGVLLSYVIAPSPDGSRLIGKPPAYVITYTEIYQSEGQSSQSIHAIYGAITCCSLVILSYVFWYVLSAGSVAAAAL